MILIVGGHWNIAKQYANQLMNQASTVVHRRRSNQFEADGQKYAYVGPDVDNLHGWTHDTKIVVVAPALVPGEVWQRLYAIDPNLTEISL